MIDKRWFSHCQAIIDISFLCGVGPDPQLLEPGSRESSGISPDRPAPSKFHVFASSSEHLRTQETSSDGTDLIKDEIESKSTVRAKTNCHGGRFPDYEWQTLRTFCTVSTAGCRYQDVVISKTDLNLHIFFTHLNVFFFHKCEPRGKRGCQCDIFLSGVPRRFPTWLLDIKNFWRDDDVSFFGPRSRSSNRWIDRDMYCTKYCS